MTDQAYDCPACKVPGSLTIADAADPRGQAVALAMMGAPVRVAKCAACGREGRIMPGDNDESALRTFARGYAEDAGLGMEVGKRYRIVWRGELHRKDHESVMDFLGRAKGTPVGLNFSARPVAGTQMIYADYIKSVAEVPKDARIVLDRIAQVEAR